jgi:hypothetical protein
VDADPTALDEVLEVFVRAPVAKLTTDAAQPAGIMWVLAVLSRARRRTPARRMQMGGLTLMTVAAPVCMTGMASFCDL